MRKIILLLCILSLSACTEVVHFSNATLSTKDINVSHVNLNNMPQTRRVKGESSSCYYILGLIPTCGTYDFIARGVGEAVEDALRKGRGDMIINAQVKTELTSYVLFLKSNSTVKGTVINLQGGK